MTRHLSHPYSHAGELRKTHTRTPTRPHVPVPFLTGRSCSGESVMWINAEVTA